MSTEHLALAHTPEAVAEWFNTNYAPLLGERANTFREALVQFKTREGRLIAETGTARQEGNWGGDGQSTLLFADFGRRFGAAVLSIDNDPDSCEAARVSLAKTLGKTGHCTVWCYDGAHGLSNLNAPIGLLYLDSLDLSPGQEKESQEQALKEFRAAEPFLGAGALLLIDDCFDEARGKGGLVIPEAQSKGWRVLSAGYQVLLSKESA